MRSRFVSAHQSFPCSLCASNTPVRCSDQLISTKEQLCHGLGMRRSAHLMDSQMLSGLESKIRRHPNSGRLATADHRTRIKHSFSPLDSLSWEISNPFSVLMLHPKQLWWTGWLPTSRNGQPPHRGMFVVGGTTHP